MDSCVRIDCERVEGWGRAEQWGKIGTTIIKQKFLKKEKKIDINHCKKLHESYNIILSYSQKGIYSIIPYIYHLNSDKLIYQYAVKMAFVPRNSLWDFMFCFVFFNLSICHGFQDSKNSLSSTIMIYTLFLCMFILFLNTV